LELGKCQKLSGTIPTELGNLGKNATPGIVDGKSTQLQELNLGKTLLFLIFRLFRHELIYF